MRLHGQMEDYLSPLAVGLLGDRFGMRGKRKDGKRNGKIQLKNLFGDLLVAPKVVDHNSHLRPNSCFQRGWGQEEGKLVSGPILNLDLHPKRLSGRGSMNREGWIETLETLPDSPFDEGIRDGPWELDLPLRSF
jgi:hypothetical protein